MNRFAILAALALCLPLTAQADEASQHAKAQELVTLMHTDRMVKQVSDNIRKQVSDAAEKVTGANAAPENQARLADFEKKIADTIDAEVGWKVMEPAFVDMYAKTFTDDEMAGIIAFYKSPSGTAFLEKTPTINSQITLITQPKMVALQGQLRQSFQDFQKSQAAAPPAAPPATPPTLAPAASTPK